MYVGSACMCLVPSTECGWWWDLSLLRTPIPHRSTQQEKAEECAALLDRANAALRALRRCPYERRAMHDGVAALQACVDEMAMAGYVCVCVRVHACFWN